LKLKLPLVANASLKTAMAKAIKVSKVKIFLIILIPPSYRKAKKFNHSLTGSKYLK
jgi:hypothetical protein